MVPRAPFLKTRFGGYYHRDTPEEDVELTHVGPGTPCGEYMRRFWQPICFSAELRDLPHRVKILGRSSWYSATRAALSDYWSCNARTAARRWSLADRRQRVRRCRPAVEADGS